MMKLCYKLALRVAAVIVLAFAGVQAAAQDSTAVAGDHNWKSELRHGRVNLDDTTLHYPRIVMTGRNVAQWYATHLNYYDPEWVGVPTRKWKVMLKNNNWLDYYDCKPFKDTKFSFDCKATSSVGIYVGYSGLTVGYSLGLNQLTGRKATSRKLELSFACARFSIDFYHMRNNSAMDITAKIRDEEPGKITLKDYTGLHRRSWGISAYRYFNDSHYAQSAAYNCGKIQLRPAGSFMAGLCITRQSFNVVGDEVPDFFDDDDEEEDDGPVEDETIFDYGDYCLSAGYGYNLPFARNWIVNGTLLLHPGIKHARSRSTSDGGSNFFCLNGRATVALAYNQSRFFVGLRGYVDSHFFNTGEYKFRSFLIDITAIAGVRF